VISERDPFLVSTAHDPSSLLTLGIGSQLFIQALFRLIVYNPILY